jgi:putative membrane protein (TIGR04086 family)
MALDVLDRRAVVAGTSIALAIAVPAALISQLLDTKGTVHDHSGVLAVAFIVVLVGFVAGGFVAGSKRTDAPLANGAMAALLAFAIVQGVGVIRRSITGDDISWLAIPFNGLIAASLGVLGGYVAGRRTEGAR